MTRSFSTASFAASTLQLAACALAGAAIVAAVARMHGGEARAQSRDGITRIAS